MERRGFLQAGSLMTAGFLAGFTSLNNIKFMNKRIIPSSSEKLPVIGIGTWQTFDVGKSPEERLPLQEVVTLLIEKGGSVIDSSPMYGKSEQVVGEVLESTHLQQSAFLATKVWTTGKEQGIKQMEKSFNLMKTKKMDLMQIHNLLDWKTHLGTLKDWKEAGKIKYIGITHYHEGAYDQLAQVMKSEKLDFLQVNYSIRKREAEQKLLPLAAEKGIAVLVNQPFESGSLFSNVKEKKLPAWSEEFDCKSWGQFFLKFILANPNVTCVIPGTSKKKHLLDNAGAGFGELPDAKRLKDMISIIAS